MDSRVLREASAWSTYRRLLGYLRPYRLVALSVLASMVIDALALTAFVRLVQPMVDDLFNRHDQRTVMLLLAAIPAIFLVRAVGTFVTSYGMAYIGRGVVETMREQIMDRYLSLPGTFFGREASGHQITRVTYNTEQVAQASTEAVRVSVTDSLTIAFMVGSMLYTNWRISLILLVMVPAIATVIAWVSQRLRRISRNIQSSMGNITGAVAETVAAWREVRIYGGQQYEARRFREVSDGNRALNVKVAATSAVSTALVQFLAALTLAAIIFLVTRPAILPTMTAGKFVSIMLAMGAILPSLKRMSNVQSLLQRGISAAEDVFSLMDTPVEVDPGTRSLASLREGIAFRDVTMRYAPGANAALNAASFTCVAGTVTALVGRSGSGKSTVAHLIPRFYLPESGQIFIDGQPLGDYRLADLRRSISWVGQDVVVFDGTVAENIAYGEMAGAAEPDIIAAARAANAWEFIQQLPQGLHSPLGQRGTLLSGGQRQRIAIARAILKNAPILILDEATSALDTESERLIQDALQRLMQDRTTLVIAHRLSTIERAHTIVVLDGGRVVEQGRHDELLVRPNGAYALLHRMQFDTAGSD